MTSNAEKYPHYYKDVKHLETVDVYRVLHLFNVTDPCLQHAIKKLLVAGGRGAKDITKDVAEAIVTLQRWQELREEDASLGTTTVAAPGTSAYSGHWDGEVYHGKIDMSKLTSEQLAEQIKSLDKRIVVPCADPLLAQFKTDNPGVLQP